MGNITIFEITNGKNKRRIDLTDGNQLRTLIYLARWEMKTRYNLKSMGIIEPRLDRPQDSSNYTLATPASF